MTISGISQMPIVRFFFKFARRMLIGKAMPDIPKVPKMPLAEQVTQLTSSNEGIEVAILEEAGTAKIAWEFRRDVLDRLDDYFSCLARLRGIDSGAYKYFGRVGFMIPGEHVAGFYRGSTSERFLDGKRVSFGGILIPETDIKERVSPSFIYFEKMAHPSRVQFCSGDIYRLTCVWDERGKGRDVAAAGSCHINVDAQGGLRLLKELRSTERTIQKGGKGRHHSFSINAKQWDYPSWIHSVWSDKKRSDIVQSPEQWVYGLFELAFATYQTALESADREVVIRIKHGKQTAALRLVLSRAKTFFKDRDATILAADGKRKRIFHYVRAHTRRAVAGNQEVRQHYRGLRFFDWNGYTINIVFPNKQSILGFTFEGHTEESARKLKEETITLGQAAKQFQEALER